MGRKERTLRIFKLDIPDGENSDLQSDPGIIHNFTEYSEEGLPLVDIDYNEFGEIEQKIMNSFSGKLKVETKVYQSDDELTEWKTFEYTEEGLLLSEMLHYQDGSVDTIHYSYDEQKRLISKITVNSDEEQEARIEWLYDNGKLISETAFNDENKMIVRNTNTWDTEGILVESLVEEFDGKLRAWRKHFFDPDGNRIKTLRYNHKDQLIEISKFFYEGNLLVRIEDEDQLRKNLVIMEYDEKGNVVKQTETDKAEELVSSVYRTFDEDNRPLTSRVYMSGHGLRQDQNYLLTYMYDFFD